MASHPVGHNADAAKNKAARYYSNRSRWPFGQAGILVAACNDLAAESEVRLKWDSCVVDLRLRCLAYALPGEVGTRSEMSG